MISPRVLFIGDPTEAVKYVGIAKKFARSTFDAGIISKVWKISDGVSIWVANHIQSKVCKVWIEAEAGGGYQFYTTSPHPQWVTWEDPERDFYPGGSGVYVPYPKVKIVDGVPDFSSAKIKAYPTGSTVEVPPVVDGRELWKYWPTPPDLDGLNDLMQEKVLHVKNTWQVNGVPESVYFSKWITPKEIESGVIQQTKHSLFHAYVQGGGQVHGCGAFQPIKYTYFTDFRYDVAPAKMKPGTTKLNGKAPDMDWFGKACLCSVVSQQYGARLFVIASSFNGVWHCYPVNAEQDREVYAAQYAVYGNQGYKSSVIPEQAKSYTPAYPGWVTPPISWRDSYNEDPKKKIFDPVYSWSFSQNGRKAISVMVERKESTAEFTKKDYNTLEMPPTYQTGLYYGLTVVPPMLPEEVESLPLEIDTSANTDGSPDPKLMQVDRRGYVELEFNIEIDGPELEDFTFSVGVISESSPDIIENLGTGALVDIAYAAPLHWGIDETKEFGKQLTKKLYRTSDVVVDEILTVWIELYRHQDQVDLIKMYDGEPSLNIPSKSKARFCKHRPGSHIELFCIPLSQSHGKGYTYNMSGNPDTVPTPAHLFVRNTNRSLVSMFPWKPEEGESDRLYYYSTRITHLDLSTLSFYCTVRLLEQRRQETTPVVKVGYIDNIISRAKKVCFVCVMGKCIDETIVGSPDIDASWLYGWLREAGYADLDEDEEVIPLDYVHNLVGISPLAHAEGHKFYDRLRYNGSDGFFCFPPVNNGILASVAKPKTNNYTYSPIEILANYFNSQMFDAYHEMEFLSAYGSEDLLGYLSAPTSPWWAIGPCGVIFSYAFNLAFIVDLIGGNTFIFGSTTIHFNFNLKLSLIEDNLAEFLDTVYDLYDNFFIMDPYQNPTYPPLPYTLRVSNDHEIGLEGFCFGQNPFHAANPRMSKSDFVLSLNTPYMKRFVHSIAVLYSGATEPDYNNEPGGQRLDLFRNLLYNTTNTQIIRSFFALSSGSGFWMGSGENVSAKNYASFTEFAGSNWIKKIYCDYKVYNFELGNMYYNSAIINHFVAHGMEFTNKIIVTPDGHISYINKAVYELKKDFCTSGVYYDGAHYEASTSVSLSGVCPGDIGAYQEIYSIFNLPSIEQSNEKLPKYVILYADTVVNTEVITALDIDWALLDGLSWHYDGIKTKHLYVYNLAYSRDDDKKYLLSEEDFKLYYNENDFKPDFRVFYNDKNCMFYPHTSEDGYMVPLNFLATQIGNYPHAGPLVSSSKHDPRPKITELRLSPLFF